MGAYAVHARIKDVTKKQDGENYCMLLMNSLNRSRHRTYGYRLLKEAELLVRASKIYRHAQ